MCSLLGRPMVPSSPIASEHLANIGIIFRGFFWGGGIKVPPPPPLSRLAKITKNFGGKFKKSKFSKFLNGNLPPPPPGKIPGCVSVNHSFVIYHLGSLFRVSAISLFQKIKNFTRN